MNIRKNPDKLHALFWRFWSYTPFLDSLLVAPIFFSDMYIPHCYKIANTPILQSHHSSVSFPSFILMSQLVPILFFSSAFPTPPPSFFRCC